MDFSPWDRSKTFRIHEAACLMAGVEPMSKRTPSREELPARAVPYCLRLLTAYVFYATSYGKPEEPGYPKNEMLKGITQDDAGKPMFMTGIIQQLTGDMVSREELHRWIQATGEKSAYQFLPIDSNRRAPSTTAPQSPATTNESAAAHQPAWTVNKPKRNTGYNWPLYRLLYEAHGAGLPRPTARDVLEEWRSNKPNEITEVLPDGFKYLDSNGNAKAADLDTIRKAIDRMTSAR